MTELHNFKITYLKNGKQVTEEFKDISVYSFIGEHSFWMRQKGTLLDNKTEGKFDQKQYWIATKDIVYMEAFGGRIFQNRKEILEFKRDNLIED